MPDLNQNAADLTDKAEAWGAIAEKNAIITRQAAEISRLRDALAKAREYNAEHGDPADTLHHGNSLLAFFEDEERIEPGRTALEANHGRS